jgi:O-antigen/teichoic acid export membrane protein
MSSLTNFALSIYLVHTLGAAQFGAFGLAYVTYGFALNASRGLATDPLMVRFSGADLSRWRRAVASCTGTAAVVGLVVGAGVLAAAVALKGTAGAAFLALGLMMPGLLLQDSWRYSFFALGRGSQAFLNDTIWAAALLPGLVFLRETGHATVFWCVLVWGAAAAVAAVAGPLQARVLPKPSGVWAWLTRHRDLGPRYLAEGAATSAAGQLRGYGIGLILGLAAVGYVQATATLIGPMTILFLSMSLVTIPEAARVMRRSLRHLLMFCLLVSAGLAVTGIAWAIMLLVALPRGLGAWLLGPMWRPTYPLVLPTMVAVIGQGVGAGAFAGLHALGASRRSLRVVVLSSAVFVACSMAGAVEWGTAGAIWGTAVAVWIGTLLLWWQLRAALPESGRVSAGDAFEDHGPEGHDLGTEPTAAASTQVNKVLARPARPSGLRRPAHRTQRTKMPTPAVKALLATGTMAALALASVTAWTLTHKPTRAEPAVAAQASATAATRAPATAHVSPPAVVRALKPVSAVSFDPYGNGQGVNRQLASPAIDESLATAWRTDWYASPQFGNLKPGTGLLLDMGRTVTITSVQLLLGSIPGADFQVRVGTVAYSLRDLRRVARTTDAGGHVHLRLTKPANGRYVLIWFTRLPPDTSGTFQAIVYNVGLEGRT